MNIEHFPAYLAPVNIRQTGSAATGVTVWAMRNLGTTPSKKVYITRIHLVQGFDGIGLAASGTLTYEIVRFSQATPTAGTAITVILKETKAPPTVVTDVRFLDTGLTTTGITFETSAYILGLPVVSVQVLAPSTSADSGASILHDISHDGAANAFTLATNEGLCIRVVTNASIIGSTLTGFIEWEER